MNLGSLCILAHSDESQSYLKDLVPYAFSFILLKFRSAMLVSCSNTRWYFYHDIVTQETFIMHLPIQILNLMKDTSIMTHVYAKKHNNEN